MGGGILIDGSPTTKSSSSLSLSSCRSPLEIHPWGLFLVFLTPALGGFLYGYDIGATSFVLSMLIHVPKHPSITTHPRVWWRTVTKVQQGLFVSAVSLGALLGSHLVLMYLSHRMGRRMEIRWCAILYIFGTFFNVLSGTALRETTNSRHGEWFLMGGIGFCCLFLGRLLFGMGVGFIMHGVSAIISF